MASYVFGFVADKIGRKITAIISLFVIGIGLILGAFMPEYISFTIARFIAGFGKKIQTIKYDRIRLILIVLPNLRFCWRTHHTIWYLRRTGRNQVQNISRIIISYTIFYWRSYYRLTCNGR